MTTLYHICAQMKIHTRAMTTKSTANPLAHFVAVPNRRMFPKGEETKGGSTMWIIPPVAGLIEPVVAPEIYVNGIGAADYDGHSLRIAYYVNEMCLHGGGPTPIVKAWLHRPLECTPLIMSQVQAINRFMIARNHRPYVVR